MSPITLSENSVEKMQVFWPWSSLRMSAWTVPRTFCFTQAAIWAPSAVVGLAAVLGAEGVELLRRSRC